MRLVPFVLALALLLPLLPAPQAAPTGWWSTTQLDIDRDRVADDLEGAAGPVRVLLSYAEPPTPAQKSAVAERGGTILREIRVVPVLVVDTVGDHLADLAASPGVVLVEEDVALFPVLDKSRSAVKADAAQKTHKVTGKGVTIAILDTGVDTTHADLSTRIVATFDASLPAAPSLGGIIPRAETPATPSDTDGHGTHVAGIAAGTGGSTSGRLSGVAPGAGLAAVKVFDAQGSSSSSYVLSGIDWALDNKDRLGIRILQMSLGGKGSDGTDALSRGVNSATRAGLLTVAAAGNEGPNAQTITIPGVAASALTVGAVDDSFAVAKFSSRGPTKDGREKPDVVAPGVKIMSTLPATKTPAAGSLPATGANRYGELSGTSMAAPHVAGIAALMLEANPDLAPGQVKALVVATTRTLGSADWDPNVGFGIVDAEAAVAGAKDPDAVPATRLDALDERLPDDSSFLLRAQDTLAKWQRKIPESWFLPGLAILIALVLVVVVVARRR